MKSVISYQLSVTSKKAKVKSKKAENNYNLEKKHIVVAY